MDKVKATHQTVRELLAQVGPLTAREAAEFFSGPHRTVSAVLSTMRNGAQKQVYICAWTRDNGYGKRYLRAVYDLGDKPDARRPRPITNAEVLANRRKRRAIPKVANSVWTWGMAA